MNRTEDTYPLSHFRQHTGDHLERIKGGAVWLTDHAAQLQPAAVSIAAWFKADAASTGTRSILRSRTFGYSLAVVPTGELWAQVYAGSGGADRLQAFTTATLRDGQWHHAAMTWDGTTMSLFVDGDLVQSATETNGGGDAFYGGDAIAIGRDGDATSYFQGCLDTVLLYDRALTPLEIRGLVSLFFDSFESGDTSGWSSSQPWPGLSRFLAVYSVGALASVPGGVILAGPRQTRPTAPAARCD